MAIIDLYNRVLERREDDSSSHEVVKPLPTSVKAIAGVIVFFGVLILGFAAWKIGRWRRNKIRAASQNFGDCVAKNQPPTYRIDLENHDGLTDEKSHPAFEPEPEPYKWKPVAFPPPIHSQNKAVTKGPSRFFKAFTPSKKPTPLPLAQSPPPAYSAQPSAPLITVQVADEKDGRRATPTAALTLQMLKLDPSSPIPSPIRTASIGPDSPLFKSLASAPKLSANRASGLAAKALPRLMVVGCTFVPSLPDELTIRVGEPVRMLEEYEDEWCLVQRVGNADAERGVVPRFCVQEVPQTQAAPPPKRSSLAVSSGLARQ